MRVGPWIFSRPESPHMMPHCRSRGLVIEWRQDDKYVASYPVPHTGWAWAWPWIIYKSVKAIRQQRRVHYGI